MRFVGPVLPGATMAFGARVPGTSYVLDPAQAAFNIGMLIQACDAMEPAFCREGASFGDTLGAILPVADFLARKAVPEAMPVATVDDLLRVSIKAREIQRCLAGAGKLDRAGCVMVATSAVTAAMFGASRGHVVATLSAALRRAHPVETAQGPQERWFAGQAVSQGVRLALLALAGASADDSVASEAAMDLAGPPCVVPLEQVRAAGVSVLQGLEAAVAGHFPPAQAAKLHALLPDRARVVAMPVHEFVSLLVRN
jgi:2-methylcitrate dehydratase